MLLTERSDEEQAKHPIISAGREGRGTETGEREIGKGKKDRFQGKGDQSEGKLSEKGRKQSNEGTRRRSGRQLARAKEKGVYIPEES